MDTGLRLKKIRLERGISLEEVHKKTRIHLNILKAIEEDSLVNFNPVYIKGFLKIYCKFLGLEPKEYISDYREPRRTVEFVPAGEKKPFSFPGQNFLRTAFFKRVRIQKKATVIVVAIGLFIFLLFNLGRMVSGSHKLARQGPRPPFVKTDKLEKINEANKTQKKAELTAAHSEGIVKAEANSIVRLVIRARENCWIRLRSDGRVIFEGTLMKGRAESWHAKNKIELTLGNAGVVDLEVNGKPISDLGKRGQKVKNIIISKEGLSIVR
jgi:cytoskeleton protein RodZ